MSLCYTVVCRQRGFKSRRWHSFMTSAEAVVRERPVHNKCAVGRSLADHLTCWLPARAQPPVHKNTRDKVFFWFDVSLGRRPSSTSHDYFIPGPCFGSRETTLVCEICFQREVIPSSMKRAGANHRQLNKYSSIYQVQRFFFFMIFVITKVQHSFLEKVCNRLVSVHVYVCTSGFHRT